MNSRLPLGGFNLPPGVTMRDIDPPDEPCPDCDGKGYFTEHTCVHTFLNMGEELKCSTCDGTGRIRE